MSSQALVNCLELLEDDNTDVRICGCKALACIKVRFHGDLLHTSVSTQYMITIPRACVRAQCSFCFTFSFSFKAEESIDQLVYICATDQEEVRTAAKQALLVLGKNHNEQVLQ